MYTLFKAFKEFVKSIFLYVISRISLTTLFVLIVSVLIILQLSSHRNDSKPEVKTYITNTIDSSVIYAGRLDTIPQQVNGKPSKYLWNGVPKDRQWLTYTEWKGEHCENRTMRKAFKKWKRNEMDSFIEFMCMAAIEETKVYGDIPPELIVAQALLESNFGKSRLAAEGNNIFGHKHRGNNPNLFLVAADDSPNDKFTKYRSIWFSIRSHSKLLMGRYRNRISGNPNLKKWLAALCGGMTIADSRDFVENGGMIYATSCYKGDVCYSNKLQSVINIYSLTERCSKYKKVGSI